MFMGTNPVGERKTYEDTYSIEENNFVKDKEVNFESELISDLEENYRLEDKNRKHKRELQKYKEKESICICS